MSKRKKTILIVLGVILLLCVVGVLCVSLYVAPTVNHALRISELLQPVLDTKNQTMNIAVSAEIGGKPLVLESDVYLVTEDGLSYLSIEQNGTAVYVADNVLFLENGKSFKIGDKLQAQAASYKDLLPHIGSLYEALKITAEEAENETNYSITVTGEQVDTLLAATSLGDALPVEGIEKLNLYLTEKNGKLDKITFAGNGYWDGTPVSLNVTLSGFRILTAGDYPIPEMVKQTAATVDPNELFSLTEDLYRLVLALAPFADRESLDETLGLSVDCGLIQLDTEMKLSDLNTSSTGQINRSQLQALPEMLGWLCMGGDISCTQQGNAYVYSLELDLQAMQQLSQMILPELAQYGSNLTEGSVTILLETGTIRSMEVSIEGKISAQIAQIPITVGATFSFGRNESHAP